jgi:hypothetical protein
VGLSARAPTSEPDAGEEGSSGGAGS